MSAESCKMSSNSQPSKGNEKTPINPSGNGTDKNGANVETYGGSSDNKALTEASDELTGQQEKYDLFIPSRI